MECVGVLADLWPIKLKLSMMMFVEIFSRETDAAVGFSPNFPNCLGHGKTGVKKGYHSHIGSNVWNIYIHFYGRFMIMDPMGMYAGAEYCMEMRS